jgi:site-specific DNA-methyltransferase (adenine-specific)
MRCSIICADVLDGLARLPDQSIDCCITDPPYGDTSLPWDQRISWLPEARRVLKPHGSVWFFTSARHLLSVDLTGWRFAQDLIWEKHNGSNFHADRFRRVHELIVQIYPQGVKWSDVYKVPQFVNGGGRRRITRRDRPPHMGEIGGGAYIHERGGPLLARSVMRVPSCHGYAVHPTQKPEDLIGPLVDYSCPPGGVILDCFAGSGTVGVVAKRHGRNFIGIELNPEYCKLARERIGIKKTASIAA